MNLDIFDRIESEVRTYCRDFPAVFARGRDAFLWDQSGRRYIDFLSGAGSLNYGHNNPLMRAAVIDYLVNDGIVQSLDLYTGAKRDFMEAFEQWILKPRGMPHRLMFAGPAGTNAVEAALKTARLATGRPTIAAFTNAFHGVSLGALAATGNRGKRSAAGLQLHDVVHLPYDNYFGSGVDTIAIAEQLFLDASSGWHAPAAFIVETVQGEGGLNQASSHWLIRLSQLAKRIGSLLIIDDIQAGCGRCGEFFSFEEFGIEPDIVCLSKSISGMGLPLSIVLIKPELDVWKPGEHNGTFRGNCLAFIAGRVAIEDYWSTPRLTKAVHSSGQFIHEELGKILRAHRSLVSA